MTDDYDAIVVGARCAGSPDRDAARPQGLPGAGGRPGDVPERHRSRPTSSTRRASPRCSAGACSTQVIATGCPPIDTLLVRLRPVHDRRHARGPPTASRPAYAPRRTVLDKILVDAAAAAGAEVREGFTVDDVVVEDGAVVGIRGHGDGGASVVERARVVIGADGRNSHVAKAVEPEQYNEKPMLQWSYYTYWSGLPVDGFEITIRPDRGWAALPTNDGLTLLVVGWPYAEATAYKADVEANYLKTLELAPEFAERVRGADARGALRRRRGAELLPQAVRARAGRSSATPATTRTRSPRRASATRSATPSCAPTRSTTPSTARRSFDDAMADYHQARDDARAADLRVHHAAGDARAAAARDAAAARRGARQPGRDGRVREHHRRHGVAGRVLRPGEHRPDHGRGSRISVRVGTTWDTMLK